MYEDDKNDDEIIGNTNSKHDVVILEYVNKEEENGGDETFDYLNNVYLIRTQIIDTTVTRLQRIVMM